MAKRPVWIAIMILVIGLIPVLWYAAASAAAGKAGQSVIILGERLPFRPSEGTGLPYQPMSLFEQTSAVVGGFVLKPLHMLLSALIIWGLLRMKSRDLAAVRIGLLFFLLGEAFCAINYLVFQHKSDLAEYLHSYGMVVGFAFVFYALFEGLDTRLIKFSVPNKKCAATELCGRCIKFQTAPCGARRLILLLLPIFLAISGMLLVTNLQAAEYASEIFKTPYRYSWPVLNQLYEARFTALLAMTLFATALATMWLDRSQPVPDSARVMASAGLGTLAFGLMRFGLKTLYFDNLIWADFWEEASELIFVLAILAILLIFQHKLFGEAFSDGQKVVLKKLFVR